MILTSHGSRAGLAVKAGRLTQTLTPSNLAYMLARTGMRYKVVVISACYSGVFNIALRQAKSLKDAFVVARSLVKKREVRERFEPSNPLMAGGENVQPLLISRP